MKAQILRSYGPDSWFEPAVVPDPELKPGHVLIEIKATSLNPLDFKLRTQELPFASVLPAILHMDFAGIVTEVGTGVEKVQLGAVGSVLGCRPGGVFAW